MGSEGPGYGLMGYVFVPGALASTTSSTSADA